MSIQLEKHKTQVIALTAALFGGLLVAYLNLGTELIWEGRLYLSWRILAVLCVFTIFYEGYKTKSWLEPISLMSYIYLLMYVGAGLYYAGGRPIRFYNTHKFPELLTEAGNLLLLGYITFYLGYKSNLTHALSEKLPKFESPSDRHVPLIFIASVLIIGWISYVGFNLSNGGFIRTITVVAPRSRAVVGGGPFFYFLLMMTAGVLLVFVRFGNRPTSWLLLLLTFLAFTLLGGRARSFVPVIAAAVYINRTHRRIPLSILALLVMTAIPIGLAIDFFSNTEGKQILFNNPANFVSSVWENSQQRDDIINVEFNRTEAMIFAVAFVPEKHPYLYGKALLNSFDNPFFKRLNIVTGTGKSLGGTLVDLVLPGAEFGLLPTLPGALFFDFGWIGVAGGMWGFGLLLGSLALWKDKLKSNYAIALYAVLVVGLIRMFTEDTNKMFEAIWPCIPIWLATRYVVSKIETTQPNHQQALQSGVVQDA